LLESCCNWRTGCSAQAALTAGAAALLFPCPLPQGWHAGLSGPEHYISVSSAGFRVHYTRKKAKKPKKKSQATKKPTPGRVAAGPGGVQKKQRKQGQGKPEKKKEKQQQTTSSL
jgi:hypothetical protein